MTDVLAAALAWHDAGVSVVPARVDGSKAPLGEWKMYTQTLSNSKQLDAWYANGHPGVGLVCGAVSGGLEMLELEGRAVANGALAELTTLITEAGLADLWVQVTADGYAERTPSGGLHLLYRIADVPVPGNTKLARDERGQILAETRGEGGYVVVAPSHGPTHPSGKAWTIAYGRPGQIPTITAAEREQLHRAFRCLDRTPPPAEPAPTRPALHVVRPDGTIPPGDDFEQHVDWTDQMLLGGAGWQMVSGRPDGYRTWRRPGKDTPGISATTGRAADRDRLYVFSSSTDFDAERPYTKFGAYALLHHGGDHSAAARELRRLGYGIPPSDPATEQRAAIAELIPPHTLGAVDGTAVRVIAEPLPEIERYGQTEDGLALVLVARHGHELRYCPQRGRWLHWNGHRWGWDDAGNHREMVRALARQLPDSEGWKTFRKRAQSAAGIDGIARLAATDARVVAHLHQLDADPWALNTPAGVVDLRTGQISPPEPAGLHTRSTLCAPDPDANPARWQQFLADTFGADNQLIAYLRRLVGYSAVGIVGPHVLPFAFGSGGNGKGVFLETLAAVLGDYATTAPVGFLMAQVHTQHETEIARLAGARMVLCSEVNDGDRFDEAKVKQLTGGDSLTARFMRQDHFTFTPTHQLWLMGNFRPTVRAGGRAFWRRLRLIPFEREVPEERIVDDLQSILAYDHGTALMAWIVAGAVEYAAGGLREPQSVKEATAEYQADQDSVARFVAERCRLGGGEHVTIKMSRVREAYEQWCAAEGEHPVSAKTFGNNLVRRFGIERARTPQARMYVGVSLLVDDDDDSVTERDDGWSR